MNALVRTLAFLVALSMSALPPTAHAQRTSADTTLPAPAGTAPLPGVDTILDARTKAVASRLRCPVCQGESIQDSPAELAAQMKTLVREQLVAGRSEVEVLDYFQRKYGQWILLEPKAEGINLLVYWLPWLFIVGGAAGLWFAVRRWTRPVPESAKDTATDRPHVNPAE